MRLSNKIVDDAISEIAGEDVLPLVKAMKNKKNISEFKLAESIKQEINKTRNMLYRLHDANLVTFLRKKDKKKGWYIYYWTFNHPQAHSTILKMKEKRIENLRKRLEKEDSSTFYTCSSKCLRVKFEHALENSFKCPECDKILKEMDNSKVIKEIQKELSILEEVSEESSVAEVSA